MTINALEGDQVEVVAGLTTGDQVILLPPPTLTVGAPVTSGAR